ncbi:MAG TPA: saccharopine dehydrogenase NADP-binding domain-containing protein [Kofleriaceae bacterium]|nr:saccharopine dehydrogenase NADP-binding domain-containing protein [Kofleriaceae bacterium]
MILVYGATGTTGALVAGQLVDHGFEVVLSGRDQSRLARLADQLRGLEIRPAQVHVAAELAAAVRGARVVISCAGPFLLLGDPVLRAAIDAGAHYMDVSGEQAFLRDAYEQHDSRARRAGVTAAPGFAWEVALGDWAASRAAALVRAQVADEREGPDAGIDPGNGPAADDLDPDAPLDEIAVGYALSRVRTTPGTRQSLIASLSRPASVWREDRWESAAPLSRTRRMMFPPPFGSRDALLWPSGEVITVPRHIAARRVETFLALNEDLPGLGYAARLASLVGPLVSIAAASPLGAFARARAGAAPPPGDEARRGIEFALVAEAGLRFRRARVALGGRDPYALSARIIALGVERLLSAGGAPPGVVAPSQLADPEASLATLVGEGWLSLAEH